MLPMAVSLEPRPSTQFFFSQPWKISKPRPSTQFFFLRSHGKISDLFHGCGKKNTAWKAWVRSYMAVQLEWSPELTSCRSQAVTRTSGHYGLFGNMPQYLDQQLFSLTASCHRGWCSGQAAAIRAGPVGVSTVVRCS